MENPGEKEWTLPCTLGMDIGTTTIVAVVYDTVTGEALAVRSIANDTQTTSPADRKRGWSEWDARRTISLAVECMAAAVAEAADQNIAAIGVTGQMHGTVLLSDAGEPITPFINWQDQRAEERPGDGPKTYIELMVEAGGSHGFERTGCEPATGYMASTLFWMARQGDERLKTPGAIACFIPDYLVSHLTGARPVTDPTNAGSAGVLDVAARDWERELISLLGLEPNLFPPVRESGSVAGRLRAEIAEEIGLKAGIPVCVACGDNQASFLGSVPNPDDTLLVNIGTGAQVSLHTPEYVRVPGLDTRCHVDGGCLLVGANLCGGGSYALLRDFFRAVGSDLFGNDSDEDLYERMTALASEAPRGADGLRCVPLFAGTRREPDARAMFTGLSASNFKPGHMARALLEGVIEQMRFDYARMLEYDVKPRSRLVGSGNGIRRNALLCKILSHAFEMPLDLAPHTEEAAVGAALLAARSVE